MSRSAALWAEFATGELALTASRQLRERGLIELDAFGPYELVELERALPGNRPWYLPALVLLGACCGGSTAYLVIWWTAAVNYPLNVGGRPLNSFVADIPIMFELSVLGAALTGFFAFLFSSGMPRLHHELERLPGFDRTSRDRFWLAVGDSAALDDAEVSQALEQLGALRVHRWEGGA